MSRFATVTVDAVDSDESDDYFMAVTDFITPTRLFLGAMGRAPEMLKRLPAYFDAKGLAISQHEAVSKDGTRIPYFEVARTNLVRNGRNPTLLTATAGFEVAEVPEYSATQRGLARKGGTYVLANIRGEGSSGRGGTGRRSRPTGTRRRGLHRRGGRSRSPQGHVPAASGIQGGSNGGLLVGNMLTLRPDLFGAIVCQVPLLDMRRYHLLLAGASWIDEYGNPDNRTSGIRTDVLAHHNLRDGVVPAHTVHDLDPR
jgi:prolyl oligopeptidase